MMNTRGTKGDDSSCLLLVTVLQPHNTCCMPFYPLATLQPGSHLCEFIFAICRSIHVLREVYVKTLHLLGIVIVSRAKKHDGRCIVKHTMQLWSVEPFLCSQVDEDTLVSMK